MRKVVFLALMFFLLSVDVSAKHVEKSFSCIRSYNSSVVFGGSFQDYCLGSGKRSIVPTPFKCYSRVLSLSSIKVPSIKDRIKRGEYIVVRVPCNLKRLFESLGLNVVPDVNLRNSVILTVCLPASEGGKDVGKDDFKNLFNYPNNSCNNTSCNGKR